MLNRLSISTRSNPEALSGFLICNSTPPTPIQLDSNQSVTENYASEALSCTRIRKGYIYAGDNVFDTGFRRHFHVRENLE
ncbi:MAG: hypothetical protein LBD91_02150 [Prevotellaceae bacterium]|jgi:hypothetical protein|nr:hypothetical protein [Prevotellaceae bacterium]